MAVGVAAGALSKRAAARQVRAAVRAAIFVLIVVLTVVLAASRPVWAHGGGSVRVETESGPYRISVQTDETPHAGWFGGVIHATIVVAPKVDPTTRVRHLEVEVQATGPQGLKAGPVTAERTLGGAYEADLGVRMPGRWQLSVAVSDGSSMHSVSAPVTVAGRSWWGDVLVVGGLMSVPVVGLIGMTRSRDNRAHGGPERRRAR